MKKHVISLCSLVLAATGIQADVSQPEVVVIESGTSVKKNFEERVKSSRVLVGQLSSEDKTVLEQFDLLANLLNKAYADEKTLTEPQVDKILLTLEFAAEKHRGQIRRSKDKTPYISHPITVTVTLMKVGKVRDVEIIQASLLHDVLDETDTPLVDIEKQFGSKVAKYVAELTQDKSLSKAERKRRQVAAAPHTSVGAAQIQLADKMCNLNELLDNPPSAWTRARIDTYFQWAESVIARLPDANPKLKEAADSMVIQYWDQQEDTKKK